VAIDERGLGLGEVEEALRGAGEHGLVLGEVEELTEHRVDVQVEVREDGVGVAGEADGEGVAAGGRHALTGIWKAASMVTDDDMLSSATATTTTTYGSDALV
jgi:hypothetical protein